MSPSPSSPIISEGFSLSGTLQAGDTVAFTVTAGDDYLANTRTPDVRFQRVR
ncbi:MAG: hypothetical protein PVJ76_14700 [Gemmatimonadota bacterium]